MRCVIRHSIALNSIQALGIAEMVVCRLPSMSFEIFRQHEGAATVRTRSARLNAWNHNTRLSLGCIWGPATVCYVATAPPILKQFREATPLFLRPCLSLVCWPPGSDGWFVGPSKPILAREEMHACFDFSRQNKKVVGTVGEKRPGVDRSRVNIWPREVLRCVM